MPMAPKLPVSLRVSLDAGSQLDHYVATFKGGNGPLTAAIGLKKTGGAKIDYDAAGGSLTAWEPMEKRMGMQGFWNRPRPEIDRETGRGFQE